MFRKVLALGLAGVLLAESFPLSADAARLPHLVLSSPYAAQAFAATAMWMRRLDVSSRSTVWKERQGNTLGVGAFGTSQRGFETFLDGVLHVLTRSDQSLEGVVSDALRLRQFSVPKQLLSAAFYPDFVRWIETGIADNRPLAQTFSRLAYVLNRLAGEKLNEETQRRYLAKAETRLIAWGMDPSWFKSDLGNQEPLKLRFSVQVEGREDLDIQLELGSHVAAYQSKDRAVDASYFWLQENQYRAVLEYYAVRTNLIRTMAHEIIEIYLVANGMPRGEADDYARGAIYNYLMETDSLIGAFAMADHLLQPWRTLDKDGIVMGLAHTRKSVRLTPQLTLEEHTVLQTAAFIAIAAMANVSVGTAALRSIIFGILVIGGLWSYRRAIAAHILSLSRAYKTRRDAFARAA